MKSIVFTGGGTGGHVFPGIAVAERVRPLLGEEYRIVWLGSSKGMEKDIVSRFSIPFYGIPAGKLRRYFSLRNLLDIASVAAGYFSSLFLLRRLNTVLVFSKGGFVTVPPVAAARTLGIPSLTHESDLDPGLATKLNARFSDRVLCAYEETGKASSFAVKAVVTGNPVRSELFEGDPERGRELLGVSPEKTLILVLGGSQGARQINRMIDEVRDTLLERAAVVHQTGALEFPRYEGEERPGAYIPVASFSDNFPHVLAAADLVVSRAGAGTLWENGVFEKPAVLVPLGGESSRGDQLRNASYFAERGAAELLSGEDVRAEVLLEKCIELLEDKERRREMGRKAGELCPADSAERIAEVIESFLTEEKQAYPGK